MAEVLNSDAIIPVTKNIDQINEAYQGSLGQEMMENSRNRINWICSKAKGEQILDVGCSQGTATIILGREGKMVTGVDICKESIEYALTSLEGEDESTRGYVEFVCADYMKYTKGNMQKYDCIIMGEVIEHIADPGRFIARAHECLSEDGILVVTVPFGINDYHDHKRTYYLTELYSSVSDDFNIIDVAFLGSWIGVVGSKDKKFSVPLDASLFTRAEQAFYLHERKLLNGIKQRKLKYDDNMKTWKAKVDIYEKENKRLEKDYNDLANSILGKIQLKIWARKARKQK